MTVGTNGPTCGFNWQCTTDTIGYAVMVTARLDSTISSLPRFGSSPAARQPGYLHHQCCCCCCFIHINRSGLNHTQYYTWLPIRYVVCWTERDQRNIYQAPMRAKEKTQTNKNDKEKGTRIATYTCQKKINDGHSTERVWHSASREPSHTLPGSQPCTQTRSIYHIPYSQGFSFH